MIQYAAAMNKWLGHEWVFMRIHNTPDNNGYGQEDVWIGERKRGRWVSNYFVNGECIFYVITLLTMGKIIELSVMGLKCTSISPVAIDFTLLFRCFSSVSSLYIPLNMPVQSALHFSYFYVTSFTSLVVCWVPTIFFNRNVLSRWKHFHSLL